MRTLFEPKPCDRCGEACSESNLRAVPALLRIAAFPMIAVMLIQHPMRVFKPELWNRYCKACYRWQVICHCIVALWSTGIVVGMILKLMGKLE